MRTRWRRRRPKCKQLFHCHSSVLVTDFSFSEAATEDVAEPKEEVVIAEPAPVQEEAPAVAAEATETAAPDAPAEVEEKAIEIEAAKTTADATKGAEEVPVAAEPETSTVYVNDVSCVRPHARH